MTEDEREAVERAVNRMLDEFAAREGEFMATGGGANSASVTLEELVESAKKLAPEPMMATKIAWGDFLKELGSIGLSARPSYVGPGLDLHRGEPAGTEDPATWIGLSCVRFACPIGEYVLVGTRRQLAEALADPTGTALEILSQERTKGGGP